VGSGEVVGDAVLAGVKGEPEQAFSRMYFVRIEPADAAGRMAAGRFNDDHLSAEIAQQFTAHQPALAGQSEHPVGREQIVFLSSNAHNFLPTERHWPGKVLSAE